MIRRIVLVCLAFGLSLVSGCAHTVSGFATAAGSAASAPIGRYAAPANGSGYSTQDWDQPMPLPVLNVAGSCDWLNQAKSAMSRFGIARTAASDSGCQFITKDDILIQVRVHSPYDAVNQPVTLLRPVTIAGIKGRLYSFVQLPDSICSATMDIRSFAAFSLDVADARDENRGDREAHCKLAQQATETLLREYVPLAGGTPSPDATRAPDADIFADVGPCQAVNSSTAYFAGISDESPEAGTSERGRTCRYGGGDNFFDLTATLTEPNTGLDGVPPAPGARSSTGKLVTLPMRSDARPDGCTLSAEFGNRQVLTLDLDRRDDTSSPSACQTDRVLMGVAILNAITG